MSDLELTLRLTADGRGFTGVVRASREQVDQLNQSVRETGDSGRRGAQGLDRVDQSARTAGQSLGSLRGLASLAAGALATIGAGQFVSNLIQVNTETQQLQASLETVTGSAENASAAWATLETFAKTTPFTLDQSVNGFIKMKSLGLDPTTSALESFGNTASAMGKDLNQMIEAVADASTSEFERLKEFGIKASQEGGRVSLTFQGVATEIESSSAAIVGYLEEIGSAQFAGAMERQMETLGGAASNLQDNIDGLFRAIGDAGANDLTSAAILSLSDGVSSLADNLETVGDVALLFSGILAGKLVTSLAASAKAKGVSTLASISAAKAEAVAAQQTLRRAGAELNAATVIQARALADARATAGTNAHAFAMQNLVAASTRATAAQLAHTSATTVAAAAMGRASIAARTLGGAMTLMGGPLGVALIAAASLYAFREELGLVKPEAQSVADGIDDVNRAMKDLSATGRQDMISGLKQSLIDARGELARLRKDLEELPATGGAAGNGFLPGGVGGLQGMQVQTQISDRMRAIELLEAKLVTATKAQNELLNAPLTIPGGNPMDTIGSGGDANSAAAKLQEEMTLLKARNGLIEAGMKASDAATVMDEIALEMKLEAQGLTTAQAREYIQLAESIKAAEQAQTEAEKAQVDFQQSLASLVNELDPVGAAFEDVYAKQQLLIEAAAQGKISTEQLEKYMKVLVDDLADAGEDGGEKAATAMEAEMGQAANRVAGALQSAITSGDWGGVGASIGGALAGAVGGMVTQSLMESMSGQAGAALLGPIAGAIAGGVAGLAMAKIGSLFSFGDWDPTEARQAAQGTGTVLGSIDEKSASIAKAVDISADATSELVGINRAMLRALQSVQLGIEGASARVVRGASNVGFDAPSVSSGSNLLGSISGGVLGGSVGGYLGLAAGSALGGASGALMGAALLGPLGILGGVLLGDVIGKLFGGKSRQVDEGINIIGGYIGDLVDDVVVQSFATFRVKKNVFSSTKTKEKYQNLGEEVTNQFALVFEGVLDSVLAGADALGIDGAAAANGFSVGTQRLSLEGLNAAQQQAELEAYFGTVFDNLAGYTVPFLEEFQRAGEGLGETLARVATQTQVTQQAVDQLGITFSDLSGRDLVEASQRLVELGGGLEQFIGSMQGFIKNFASDAQQFEIAQNGLTTALEQSKLTLPNARDGYYELLQAQDGSTAAGAQNIATLLRLQDTADTYYTMLEDYQSDLLTNGLREAEAAAQAVTSAIDSLSVQTDAFSRNQRAAALDTLRAMAESGVVRPGSDLTSALDTATSINNGEFGTVEDYVREVARTGAVLADLDAITQEQVTVEQRMLDSLEQQNQLLVDGNAAQIAALNDLQSSVDRNTASSAPVSPSGIATSRMTGLDVTALVDEVRALRTELKASQGSIARHTQKSARVLERLEIDGIEVRE